MPLLQRHSPSWEEAINEPGAVENVINSALIVGGLMIAIIFLGFYLNKRPARHFTDKQQFRIMLAICGVIFLAGYSFDLAILMVPPVILSVTCLGMLLMPAKPAQDSPEYIHRPKDYYKYHGHEIDLSHDIVIRILEKRSPYFNQLPTERKDIFIRRLVAFIRPKTFIVYAETPYREMPILISASAVQFSFGLTNYLLENFKKITVYPGEFINTYQGSRFVIGNVSNNCINISWKHFLEGVDTANDGVNVGLHEMAHAYHYQHLLCNSGHDQHFRSAYAAYDKILMDTLAREKINHTKIYTEYSLTQPEEFWAETIELFFEKPTQLRNQYRPLFEATCGLLNQEPCIETSPAMLLLPA